MAQSMLNALTLSNPIFRIFSLSESGKKFVITLSLKFPEHLKCVATLPCEIAKCQQVIVSVGVSRMGKTDIVFVEPGAKVNSEYYCQHVLGGDLLPEIRAICQRYSWTLQQDGAPSHTARNTLTYIYLRRENVTFIEPDMWPPNSPDLIPVA